MKARKKIALFFLLAAIFLIHNLLLAQATSKGDTLIIGPINHDGTPVGALNYYINSDSTANGDRVHSVYKLLHGKTYIITEPIIANYPLTIVADSDESVIRPLIRAGLKTDGSPVSPLIETYDNMTLINLYISGIAPTGDASIGSKIIMNKGENARHIIKSCVFENEFAKWGFLRNRAPGGKYYVSDCKVRNFVRKGATWTGTFLTLSIADTVKMVNNTFFNLNGPVITTSEDIGVLYAEFDHNTFVNFCVHQWIMNVPVIAKVTNNIFYNCFTFSTGPKERSEQVDKTINGIIHEHPMDPAVLDSVWSSKYDPNGDGTLVESERAYELKNNAWFYSQPIRDYWAANDSIAAQTWMNDTVRVKWFDDNEGHPLFVEENTINEDPGFLNAGGSDVLLAQNNQSILEGTGGVQWSYNTDNDPVQFEWPLPEDLSYTNATLLTAAEGGFPVGDLNWYLDKKKEWVTGVTSDLNTGIPTDFNLSQNYPNPFNPTTNMTYRIAKNVQVSLTVYNLLGQKIRTLVNKKQAAGQYRVQWDGRDNSGQKIGSGIFFYTLNVGDKHQITKKMVMVK
ncbi:MAG: T9SS type A sorting domain-containing protein [Calditrichaeota bacterium]|nr:T9SS type A sorting domain-containing protein [Calditrichota bacterium]